MSGLFESINPAPSSNLTVPTGMQRVHVQGITVEKPGTSSNWALALSYSFPDFDNITRKHYVFLPSVYNDDLEGFTNKTRKFVRNMTNQLFLTFIYIPKENFKEVKDTLMAHIETLEFPDQDDLALYIQDSLRSLRIDPEKDYWAYFYNETTDRKGQKETYHRLLVPTYTTDETKKIDKWAYWSVFNYRQYTEEQLNGLPSYYKEETSDLAETLKPKVAKEKAAAGSIPESWEEQ